MITFNNIVERFKVFAENHFFIETFSFGSPDDVDLTKFTNFPLMHLVYTGATYDAGTKTYNLEVYILDVPGDKTKKVDRQKEVVSDAEQCAEDIIADIKNGGNIFLFAQDYEVVNANTTPLEEETKNVLSGVLLDLSVAIPYEWDACNAPIDGVEPGGTEVTYARRGVLRMLTLDGATDVPSVRTIKVTNGTLTDDGDGVVTLDTGGVDTLAGLTDVDVTGVTDGQVLKYDDATGEWIPANDQSATSLGNLDDVSLTTPANREALIYDGDNWVNDNVTKADVGLGNVDNTSDADKPVSTATQTALDAKANTADVPTELNDLSDVSLTTPTGNQALIYNATASAFQALPSYTNRFEDEAEQAASDAVTGTGLFIERYYSAKADGDGIFLDAQSDTPTAGKVIKRKIYQIAGGLDDSTVTGWTLIHTFADDTAYSATTSTFEGFRDGDTYGTPPFTLAQTWEEVTAAPSFTGLLNESYGSGAEAAYSTRRLNGNYSGDCMTIRRASDGTTQSIGFVGEEIDESAIETFCTGTTCTVQVWRDQSGNGNDAEQTTAANQPTIYTGGAIVKENGRVAVDFDGSTNVLTNTALQNSFEGAAQAFTMLHVAQTDDTSNFQYSFSLLDGANATPSQNDQFGLILANDNKSGGFIRDYSTSTTSFPKSSAAVGTSQHLNTAVNTGSTLSVYASGTAGDSVSVNYPALAFDYASVGGRYGGSTPSSDTLWNGKIQEILAYASDKSTDRTSIESNIGDYFTQNTPLLDTYSGAAAAYSLRLLDSSYVGSAVEVYNGSSYADIGFNVFGELDTVALAAHCGSNDGFVSKWYDQSSNGNTAAQTTTANMPKIYDGTTGVVTENGKPAVTFQQDRMSFTSVDVHSAFIAINATSSFGAAAIIGQVSGTNLFGLTSPSVRYRVSGNNYDHTLNITGHHLYSFTVDALLSLNVYEDSNIATESPQTVVDTLDVDQLMYRESVYYVNGNLQELILYSSDQSTNRTNIEDNINTFYNIY